MLPQRQPRSSEFSQASQWILLLIALILPVQLLISLYLLKNPYWHEAILAGVSVSLVLLFLWIAFRDGHPERHFLALLCAFGHIISWVLGGLSCIYLLRPYGFEFGFHTAQTMLLLNTFIIGLMLGSVAGSWLFFSKGNNKLFREYQPSAIRPYLLIFGALWLLLQMAAMASGSLHSRWETGNELSSSSSMYFIVAFVNMTFVFFFFLGASIKRPYSSPINAALLSAMIAACLLLGITGGREYIVRILFYTLLGMLFTAIPLRHLLPAAATGGILSLGLIFAVGAARTEKEFIQGDAKSRIQVISQSLQSSESEGSFAQNQLMAVMTRVAEPSGQKVIDNVTETQDFVGLIHFERLLTIYFPKFIYPEKQSLDDGFERLIARHGWLANRFSTAPITLMADLYERGSTWAVLLGGLLLGLLLSATTLLLSIIPHKILGAALLVHFGISALRFYSFSFLGVMNNIFYFWLKDALIIAVILLFCDWLLGWNKHGMGVPLSPMRHRRDQPTTPPP